MSVQAVLLHTFLINLSMCVLLHRYPVQSFIPRTSQRKRVLKKSRGIFSSKTSSASLEETSSQLLSLVLDRWNRGTRETNEEESIDRLMQSLSDARASFDPDECLTGPFYATLYTSGPTPLWERLSLSAFGTRNIQGQQLTKVGDGEGRVLNYSEAWGRGESDPSFIRRSPPRRATPSRRGNFSGIGGGAVSGGFFGGGDECRSLRRGEVRWASRERGGDSEGFVR